MRLSREKEMKGGAVYRGEDGAVYMIRAVNRSYEGRKAPPRFYMERRVAGGKLEYLSGLFPTKAEGVYSCDLRDRSTGIRVMHLASFLEGGEAINLEPKREGGLV